MSSLLVTNLNQLGTGTLGTSKRNLPILTQSQGSSVIHMLKLAKQLVRFSLSDLQHYHPSTNNFTQYHWSHHPTIDFRHKELRCLHLLRRLLCLLRHMGILLRARNQR